MEDNRNSYKEVSGELGKKLVKLYGAKIFPRQGKVFADMLFQTGVEAGTYIAALTDTNERGIRIKMATEAIVKLNQTVYLINVMKEARYYEKQQVAEIEAFLQELLRAMRNVLNTAFEQGRAHQQHPVAPKFRQVAPKAQIIAAPKPAPKPAVVQVNVDPDGFNTPVNPETEVAVADAETDENKQ